MPVVINKEICEGCASCVSTCTNSAIVLKEVNGAIIAEIVSDKCTECLECIEFCLRGAIKQV